jgi:hypothetical protein
VAAHYQRECAGPTLTGAELDRIADTNNSGRRPRPQVPVALGEDDEPRRRCGVGQATGYGA